MDLLSKKKALRMFPYGLYILTTGKEKEVSCCTVNWVSQSSMNPPLVMLGLEKESHTYKEVKKNGTFVIHLLGKGQKDIAQKFFKPPLIEGDKINGLSIRAGITGIPVLLDFPAFLECKVVEIVACGDHNIVVGEVIEAGIQNDLEPLTLKETGWHYGG